MSGASRRRLRVFAGPNGSGKSTLFERFRRKYDPVFTFDLDLSMAYRSYLFDNSGPAMRMIAEAFQGKIRIVDSAPPLWFVDVVRGMQA